MSFPDDLNGDVFRSMEAAGIDFSIEHVVDFHAVFATEEEAHEIAMMYVADQKAGERLENIETEPHEVGGMVLTISKSMLLTHEAVTAFETKLGERVALVEGYLDGWGVLH